MNPVPFHVGNRRLLKLAKFLRTSVPSKRFYYSMWAVNDLSRGQWKKGEKKLSCGTAGCALGWATTIPSFRRLGLTLAKRPSGDGCVTIEGPFYGGGFYAAVVLFGISPEEARYLFSPISADEDDATPKKVARKIEKFVEDRIKNRGKGTKKS